MLTMCGREEEMDEETEQEEEVEQEGSLQELPQESLQQEDKQTVIHRYRCLFSYQPLTLRRYADIR